MHGMTDQSVPHSIVERRTSRHNVTMGAQCRTQSGLRDTGVISDISADGCRVSTNSLFVKVGVRVVIKPEGMEGLSGVVRWIVGNTAGVQFDSPLYPPIVEHLSTRFSSGKLVSLERY